MGVLTSADSIDGARRKSTGYPDTPDCVRNYELGAVRYGTNNSDVGHCKPMEAAAQRRQLATLAQLVSAIEPVEADKLAQRLIDEFGSLGLVLASAGWKIAEVTGNHTLAGMLTASRAAVLEGLREEVSRSPINLSSPSFMRYLIGQMQGEDEEHLHVIFIDSNGRYIRDERVASGDWTNVTVRLRPLFRRTMDLQAANLVLCHNHPSGDANPSKADINFTNEVSNVARSLGIKLLDHMIVAGPAVFSMRNAGYL